jgi:DNA polymerase
MASFSPSAPAAAPFVPKSRTLASLRAAAAVCKGCELHRHATQTVFGEGPAPAPILLVGEQPGDVEDRRGRPFVGPAGEMLARALEAAGIVRDEVYVTNIVKHFKFIERSRRRIHQTPRQNEVTACRPWFEAELEAVRPDVVVCLGATAARTLLGDEFRVLKQRGRMFTGTRWAPQVLATLHPAAVLRAEPEERERLYAMLSADLAKVREVVAAVAVG